jgi:hypothetical protein
MRRALAACPDDDHQGGPVGQAKGRYREWPLVGVAGFEPAASSSRTKRAAKLRYTPPPPHRTSVLSEPKRV